MKKYLNHENLPWLTLGVGGIGLLLRVWLLSTENEKGFVASPHFSGIALTVLSLAVLAALVWATRELRQAGKATFNFPASRAAAIGTWVAGVLWAVCSFGELSVATALPETVCALLGILSAGALAYSGYCRLKGLPCAMLIHAAVCVWLMMKLVCMYRSWSSDPQLEDYCYQLLAVVCAMFSAYHRAAFDADSGRRAPYAFFALAGIYCCCLSMASPDGTALYLGIGIWLFCNLCSLKPMPRSFREEQS